MPRDEPGNRHREPARKRRRFALRPQRLLRGFDQGEDEENLQRVMSVNVSATQFDRRRTFVASYAWAVPTREAVKSIDDFVGERTMLEICAGQGLWAGLISFAGTAVVATDGQAAAGAHFPVKLGEAKAAVLSHPECRALLVSWPPFKEGCAFHALSTFTGDRVVYVGDVRFTAEARFHSLLDASWRLTEQIALPSWPGTADSAFFYERA